MGHIQFSEKTSVFTAMQMTLYFISPGTLSRFEKLRMDEHKNEQTIGFLAEYIIQNV